MTKRLIILTFLMTLVGCSSLPDTAFRTGCSHNSDQLDTCFSEEITGSKLYTLEYNQQGESYLQEGVIELFNAIYDGNTQRELVIFVHDGQHNAEYTDPQYQQFRHYLAQENSVTATKTGIYIGWRGKPGRPQLLSDTLAKINVFSLPSRKRTAVSLGNNGLTLLLRMLDQSISDNKIDHYHVIGHKTGASAVFHAAKHRLTHKNNNRFILLDPAINSAEFQTIPSQINVQQTPKMLIIQTETASNIQQIINNLSREQAAIRSWLPASHQLTRCRLTDASCISAQAPSQCSTQLRTTHHILTLSPINACAEQLPYTWVINSRSNVPKENLFTYYQSLGLSLYLSPTFNK